jgi:glycosyltransferase involved in cell wall biosynthesis
MLAGEESNTVTQQTGTRSLVRVQYPEDSGEEPAWAHVSGWALLSGQRQTLSCVVLTRDHAPRLMSLVPTLSDLLTECGYPWEMVIVDSASRDRTEAIARSWCELPGFRALMLREDFGRGTALMLGLDTARGDAVLVVHAGLAHPLELVRQMVFDWEAGAPLCYAVHDAELDESRLCRWDPSQGNPGLPDEGGSDAGDLMLLDRRVVEQLLH